MLFFLENAVLPQLDRYRCAGWGYGVAVSWEAYPVQLKTVGTKVFF